VHGFADQHLPQHGPHGSLAVAAAREGRAARALEGDVATAALAVDDLPQQQGPAVAQLGRELAKLVAGVGLGNGAGAFWQSVAGEQGGQVIRRGIRQGQAQVPGQAGVEVQQPGRRGSFGLPGNGKTGQVPGVGVIKREGRHGAEGLN